MERWSKEQIREKTKTNSHTALYFYTTLCGTCQLASRLLEITEKLVPHFHIGKADLNYMPEMAGKYGVESVPCLLIFKNGALQEKIYAFESVTNLYDKLQQHT